MFRFDMHILKSHSHTRTHYKREKSTRLASGKKREEITEDKCQRSHTKYH